HQHGGTVPETDQVVDVHDQPGHPTDEAGESEIPDLAHRRVPSDRGQGALVHVAEWLHVHGCAISLSLLEYDLSDVAHSLHGERREHGKLLAFLGERGQVTDGEDARRARDAKMLVDLQ